MGGWPSEERNALQAQAGTPLADDRIPLEVLKRLDALKLPMTGDGVIMLWQSVSKALTEAKADEMALRLLAVKYIAPDRQEGMNNVPLGNGFVAKVGAKFNRKLDDDRKKVAKALDDIANVGNEGAFIADRLIKWTATLVLSEYRLLEAEDATPFQKEMKVIIDGVLTIEEGAPTLEIKPPKGAK